MRDSIGVGSWLAAKSVHAAVAIGVLLLASRALAVEPVCTADCSGDNMVAVNELVTCVGIVLGNADPSVCPACDGNGDGSVNIADLVGGVGNLLTGCPEPVDTATPEPTETLEATRTPTEAGTPTTTGTPTVIATPIDVASLLLGARQSLPMSWLACRPWPRPSQR